MKKMLFLLAALLALEYLPANAASIAGNLNAAASTLTTCSSPGDGSATLELSGTWTGTITLQTSLAQTSWTTLTSIYPYGTSAAAAVTANGLYQAALSGGVCVQVSGASLTGLVGVRLTTAPGGLAVRPTNGTVTAVTASGNLSSSGGATPNLTLNATPTITGTNFSGIPNAALVTPPVTAVTASGNLASSGGLTPNVTLNAAPTITGTNFSGIPNAALVTPPVTAVTASGNLASSGGLTPNVTLNASPAIQTGLTFTANPGGGTSALLNDYEVGTYVPADGSGAGLVITNNETAQYIKTGRHVWFTCDITYPTTANSSTAAITLPPFPANGVHAALSISFNSAPIALAVEANSINTTTFSFVGVPSITQRTNVQMSTFRAIVSGTYESAT